MLVSICIPTYNSPDTLKKCLDSILTQTFQDYELIISDDSTTGDVAILLTNYDFGDKLIYVNNEVPLGSPSNWNNALRLAKGKYIKMMHHDDYFSSPRSLEKFVNSLESNPSAHFSCSYTTIHFKQTGDYFLHKQSASQIVRVKHEPEFLFFRNVIGAPSATFFRNHKEFFFNVNYKWLVDVEFYIRYLHQYAHPVFIPESLVTVVDGEEGQITRTISNDRSVVIPENLNLFSSIYTQKLDRKKARLFFEELFLSFDITTYSILAKEFEIPSNLQLFIQSVFEDLPKNKLLKKLKKRLLTSRYNKTIFKIERF